MYDRGIIIQAEGRRASVSINPREVPYLMPYITSKDNNKVRLLSNAIKEKTGVSAKYNCGLSVADENLIAMQGIPIISYGPIGEGEHSSEEWVSKQELFGND